jgi:hypothetical protein
MNGDPATRDDGDASTLRPGSRAGSTISNDDGENLGDYSTRMDEIFDDERDDNDSEVFGGDEEEEDEGFVYEGVDAPPKGAYRDQLRDVLGSDNEEDEDDELPMPSTSDSEKPAIMLSPPKAALSGFRVRPSVSAIISHES